MLARYKPVDIVVLSGLNATDFASSVVVDALEIGTELGAPSGAGGFGVSCCDTNCFCQSCRGTSVAGAEKYRAASCTG